MPLLSKSCSRFNELGLNIPLRLPYGYLTVTVNHKVTIRVMHIWLVGCPNLGRRRPCHPKPCHPISKLPETVSPDLENLGNVDPPPQITRQVVFLPVDKHIGCMIFLIPTRFQRDCVTLLLQSIFTSLCHIFSTAR